MTLRIGTLALVAPLTAALLATTAAAQAPAIEIAPGETITGALDGKDATLEDATFFECYAVTGAPGSSVLVTMSSTAFDTFLIAVSSSLASCLELGADTVLTTDDDGGGGPNGTDSQLTLTFDGTGRFLIAANAFEAGATGEYTLRVEAVAGGGGAVVPPKGPAAAAVTEPVPPPVAPVPPAAPAVVSK